MIALLHRHVLWRLGSLDNAFRVGRREKQRRKTARYKAKGCSRCGRKVTGDNVRCTFCRAMTTVAAKSTADQRIALGLCSKCGKRRPFETHKNGRPYRVCAPCRSLAAKYRKMKERISA